jgi:hypothetical protein
MRDLSGLTALARRSARGLGRRDPRPGWGTRGLAGHLLALGRVHQTATCRFSGAGRYCRVRVVGQDLIIGWAVGPGQACCGVAAQFGVGNHPRRGLGVCPRPLRFIHPTPGGSHDR